MLRTSTVSDGDGPSASKRHPLRALSTSLASSVNAGAATASTNRSPMTRAVAPSKVRFALMTLPNAETGSPARASGNAWARVSA